MMLSRTMRIGLLSKNGCKLMPKQACAFSTALENNPLLAHGQLPKFDDIDAETHVRPAVKHGLLQLREGLQHVESRLRLDQPKSASDIYDISISEMERISAPLSYSWAVTSHLMGVKNSEDLRGAHEDLLPSVVAETQCVQQSGVIYDALVKAKKLPDFDHLESAKRRIIESSVKSMEHSGVGLQGDEKDKFNNLQQECAMLHQQVQNNVLDATKQFRLDIHDKGKIAGLPETALTLASSNYNDAMGEDKELHGNPVEGPWSLTLDMPSLLPSLQHLENRDLRETLYRASREVAASGDFDNSQNILRILELRREMASMLGFNNYAELSLSSKMAPSPADVAEMSEMLKMRARPFAERELAELQFYAEGECGFQGGRLQHWDIPFYSERLREHLYSFTDAEIRPYFSLPRVLEGLFQLVSDLFGVKVVERTSEVQCWHDDVRFFAIIDEVSDDHLASFYLDPYSRPAEKRGGAWMAPCIGKSIALGQNIPVAYLVCNGSPQNEEGISLMTFREVETLFHEAGHALQHMLTECGEGGASGIENVEWDAVELPSQFMENWCYHDKTVMGFAKHYETGEPLPSDLFDKIKSSRKFQQGLMMLRQLFLGQVDMALHTISSQKILNENIDLRQIQNDVAKEYLIMQPLDNDRQLNSFLHIFGGSSYAAGYYSYKWAEILSADAFAAFEEAGLENEAAMRDLGRKFRDTVLAQGGAEHPLDVFIDFRGRQPDHNALLRHSGLLEAS